MNSHEETQDTQKIVVLFASFCGYSPTPLAALRLGHRPRWRRGVVPTPGPSPAGGGEPNSHEATQDTQKDSCVFCVFLWLFFILHLVAVTLTLVAFRPE